MSYHMTDCEDEEEYETRPRARTIFFIIAIILGLAAYMDHHQTNTASGVHPRATTQGQQIPRTPWVTRIAQDGDTAWGMIRKVNGPNVDMEAALTLFKQWNGTTTVDLGESYRVPVYGNRNG